MTKISAVAARMSEPDRPGPAALAPIPRDTVQERVYRELRKALIYGRFEPGQALTLHELSTYLDTSATPIREALARLVSEQALESTSNRSVRVPGVSVARIDDLLQARRVIEGAVLDLAAPRLTARDFDALRAETARYARIAAQPGPLAIDEALESNLNFHFRLYGACGSPVLTPIIESLWLQSGALVRRAVTMFRPGALSAFHFHDKIVDALERGDVAAARAALSEDIGRAFSLLRDQLQEAEG